LNVRPLSIWLSALVFLLTNADSKTHGLKGQQYQDTPMRKFGDNENKYLNKWELLGLT
jgi:phage gp16-like protein